MKLCKGKNHLEKIDDVLRLPEKVTLTMFQEYIKNVQEINIDVLASIRELDAKLALVQNHITFLSLFLKQHYMLPQKIRADSQAIEYFTKQELAIRLKVSVRTVTNWILDGLESEDIGGVKRISIAALQKFKSTSKGKKFHWRSIKKPFDCDL